MNKLASIALVLLLLSGCAAGTGQKQNAQAAQAVALEEQKLDRSGGNAHSESSPSAQSGSGPGPNHGGGPGPNHGGGPGPHR